MGFVVDEINSNVDVSSTAYQTSGRLRLDVDMEMITNDSKEARKTIERLLSKIEQIIKEEAERS